jgi:hypothetical protein
MNCTNCGQTIDEGARFCRNCGQPVAQTPPAYGGSQAPQPPPQQPVYPPPAYQQPSQPPYQQPGYQQPQQPVYQQPVQPPAYQQPNYQQPSGAPPYQQAGTKIKLPANWKIYLPMLGTFLAFLGFILPWISSYGFTMSGFSVASLAGQYSMGEATPILFAMAFWIAFICSLVGPVIFWKNPKSRLIAAIGGGVGLLMMIITAATFGGLGGSAIGFGYILCWIGFAVLLGGTLFAWKELEYTPAAPPNYYPPA